MGLMDGAVSHEVLLRCVRWAGDVYGESVKIFVLLGSRNQVCSQWKCQVGNWIKLLKLCKMMEYLIWTNWALFYFSCDKKILTFVDN